MHQGRGRSERFEIEGFSSKFHIVGANFHKPLAQMGMDLAIASIAYTKTYHERCALQHNKQLTKIAYLIYS